MTKKVVEEHGIVKKDVIPGLDIVFTPSLVARTRYQQRPAAIIVRHITEYIGRFRCVGLL